MVAYCPRRFSSSGPYKSQSHCQSLHLFGLFSWYFLQPVSSPYCCDLMISTTFGRVSSCSDVWDTWLWPHLEWRWLQQRTQNGPIRFYTETMALDLFLPVHCRHLNWKNMKRNGNATFGSWAREAGKSSLQRKKQDRWAKSSREEGKWSSRMRGENRDALDPDMSCLVPGSRPFEPSCVIGTTLGHFPPSLDWFESVSLACTPHSLRHFLIPLPIPWNAKTGDITLLNFLNLVRG